MNLINNIEKNNDYISLCNLYVDEFKYFDFSHENLQNRIISAYELALSHNINLLKIKPLTIKFEYLLSEINENIFKDILFYGKNLIFKNYTITQILNEYIEYRITYLKIKIDVSEDLYIIETREHMSWTY